MTDKEQSKSRPRFIRIRLYKPMGIIFEPIPQKYKSRSILDEIGARIKHLTRDGAASKLQELEVGDELVGVDDEFITKLPFDDIMDIFVQNQKSFSLLFRARPVTPLVPMQSNPKQLVHSSPGKSGFKAFTEKREMMTKVKLSTDLKKIDEERSMKYYGDENQVPNFDRGLIERFFDTLCAPCGMKDIHNPSPLRETTATYIR